MITQTVCTSFKSGLLKGEHDLSTDTIKLALYTSSASLSATTTAYSVTDEISGTGYVAGGATLSGVSISTSGEVAYVDWSDVVFSSADFSPLLARGALIYNDTHASDASICVLDFGVDKVTTGADFTIEFPANNSSDAVLRIP